MSDVQEDYQSPKRKSDPPAAWADFGATGPVPADPEGAFAEHQDEIDAVLDLTV